MSNATTTLNFHYSNQQHPQFGLTKQKQTVFSVRYDLNLYVPYSVN
jgi:uncharacterized protein YwgA